MDGVERIADHATEFLDAAEALRLEDTLWWCVGRRAILKRYLDRTRREVPQARILEIGCGSGGNLGLLAGYGEVSAVERSAVLAERARARSVAAAVYTGDVRELDLPARFELTCLLDVLEHAEDDDAFLTALDRIAQPGHLLLLTVPACACLWSPHDELLHHYRRYSKRGVERLLRRHGYTVLKGSYFVFFLFPLVAAARLGERLRARLGRAPAAVNVGVVPRWANTALVRLLELEAAIAERVPLPIGVWFVALAKKS
jgi:SAM-dependent methyltransferase